MVYAAPYKEHSVSFDAMKSEPSYIIICVLIDILFRINTQDSII